MENKLIINSDFTDFIAFFKEENQKLNLISKNEINILLEKHIYDSLAINLFFDKYRIADATLLDIGTGGGFPAFPIAIEHKNITVFAIDSIRKKIDALHRINQKLNLNNMNLLCDRVENINNKKFDIVTARAVSELTSIFLLARNVTKKYMVFYKSKKVYDELNSAKKIIRKSGFEVADIITYTLPLKEVVERNLVIIKNNSV